MNLSRALLLLCLCWNLLASAQAQDLDTSSTSATASQPHTATPDAPAPLTYSAHYEASANRLSASATRTLSLLDNGHYELVNDLQATVLGQPIATLAQRSEFHYVDEAMKTDLYTYKLSGIKSDRRRMTFDWDAGIVESTADDETWELALQAQTFDPLSHQLALRQQLLAGNDTDFEYAVVDGDEIEQQRYELLGEEILETPLGKLNTLKFERVRAAGSSRATIIWLAKDWNYLIARIEQVNGSGLAVTVDLEEAEIGGASVSTLP